MLTIWETVRHTDIVTLKITNRDLRMPYATVSFRMTLSDLEWLSKIFSDTKRRAVSLRQLSFLSVNVLPSQQWNNSQNRLTFAKFGMVFWLKVHWHKSGIDIKEICYKNIVAHNRKIEQLMWLTLDLSSSRVKDTWATRWRQTSLVTASCCATSQLMPMLFKYYCILSIQFFHGLPGLYYSVQLVLAVCCRPFAERARASSVFSLLWYDLSSPVMSAPGPLRPSASVSIYYACTRGKK